MSGFFAAALARKLARSQNVSSKDVRGTSDGSGQRFKCNPSNSVCRRLFMDEDGQDPVCSSGSVAETSLQGSNEQTDTSRKRSVGQIVQQDNVEVVTVEPDVGECGELDGIDAGGVCSNFVRGTFDGRRKLVHSLFKPPEDGRFSFYRRLRTLSERGGRSPIGAVYAASHDDHIHVIHGCNFADERCRCSGIKRCFGEAYKSVTSPSDKWDDGRRSRMWEHLGKGPGRRRWHIRQDSHNQSGHLDGVYILSAEDERRPEEEVPCEDEFYQCGFPSLSEGGVGSAGSDGAAGPAKKKRRGASWFATIQYALEIGQLQWISSPDAILNLDVLTKEPDHNYNIICSRDKLLKGIASGQQALYSKIRPMRMESIISLIDSNATFGYNRIATREDSLLGLKHFFQQFDDGYHATVKLFHDWFNQDLGKKNTICLIGPPSCGKTWVANAFMKLGLFGGSIGAWNKNDNKFAFNNCVTARIVMHDECKQPMNDIGYIEKLKEIYAGSEGCVDRKFTNDARASGCPVIATCNSHPVSNKEHRAAFEERITYIHCNQVPEMKEFCEFPCNPLAIWDLVSHVLSNEIHFEDEVNMHAQPYSLFINQLKEDVLHDLEQNTIN
ncbi:Uncharacterized protein APZ42_031456 [Daphnia magna]|uniref:SF3 helicase domain-containing protein n=1 Tax=Daphnia magna TaxID=35525 RepID=A0A164MUI8_9CRUS|nr:Uncharacterized protein APZ42_031456 [Daphnia magna]